MSIAEAPKDTFRSLADIGLGKVFDEDDICNSGLQVHTSVSLRAVSIESRNTCGPQATLQLLLCMLPFVSQKFPDPQDLMSFCAGILLCQHIMLHFQRGCQIASESATKQLLLQRIFQLAWSQLCEYLSLLLPILDVSEPLSQDTCLMMRSLSPLLSCPMQGSRIAVAVVLVLLAVFVFFLVFWLVRRRRRNAFQVSPFALCWHTPFA